MNFTGGNHMKKAIIILFALLMLLCCPALAESTDAMPRVEATLSQSRFTGPGPVNVSITVSNVSDADTPGPCALYAPDGARITTFGTPSLRAGEALT